ncbi:MAG: HEAT repeat domain-containing protein [Bradymonadales bacterium]|nr:HEAT repeat domain-containing protein [Bradymonadales bacterium]
MATTQEKQILSQKLEDPDPAVRLDAARRFLVLARTRDNIYSCKPALRKAIDDPDPAVRKMAALALVADLWAYGALQHAVPLIEQGLAADDEEERQDTLHRLLEAARQYQDIQASAPPMVGLLVRALKKPDRDTRLAALHALGQAAAYGADIRPAVPDLMQLMTLSDEGMMASAAADLWFATLQGSDLTILCPVLESYLYNPSTAVRYKTAHLLTGHYLLKGHGEALERLAGWEEGYDVREGVVDGLAALASEGVELAVALPALCRALQDSAGGVVHGAVEAFAQAACHQVDLSPALPALRQALDRIQYSDQGWTFGLDIIGHSDLRAQNAVLDVARLMACYFIGRDDWGSIRSLLEDSRPMVQAGAQQALRKAEKESKDDARLEEIRRLLALP